MTNYLNQLFETFKYSAFRYETLPVYRVGYEKQVFQDFSNGLPRPPDYLRVWIDFLQSATKQGKAVERVRFFKPELSSYEQFEIAWAYDFTSKAGENLKVLQSDQKPYENLGDFWLFDDKTVAKMQYSPSGEFIDAMDDSANLEKYLRAKKVLLEKSIDYAKWRVITVKGPG